MLNRTGWLLLCAPLAAAGLLLPITTGGCQSSNNGGGGSGAATTTPTHTGGSGNTGNGGTGNVGNTGGGGNATTCGVGAETHTISEITTGAVGTGIAVKIEGAVVMSQKWLVSKSNTTGSCLWGFFISAPGITTTGPNTGILALSYGTNASIADGGTVAYCPKLDEDPIGDKIPDDIQPGDLVDVIGETDKFLLNQCATWDGGVGATDGQYQLAKVCSVTKTGHVTPPTPAVISGADLAKIGSPTDSAFHDQWGGVKVEIDSASADPSGAGGAGSVIGQYGIITLNQNDIGVGDKIYYRGYQKSQVCHAGPVFNGSPVTWTKIQGFGYLDYCTWDLQVNDKCADFNPASTDCTTATPPVTTCAPY